MLQTFEQKAGQGVVIAGLRQIELQLSIQLDDFQIPRHQPGSWLILHGQQVWFIGFITEFIPDNFAGEVGGRHEALGATMLIHDQQQGIA